MKILITGGKSALALKLLKGFSQQQVVLADYGEMPNFSSATYSFLSLGEKNEDAIAHNLLNYCLNESIDVVLPLHAFEILPVAKAKVLFNEFNIDLLLPDAEGLNAYLQQQPEFRGAEWVVFRTGKVLFSSIANSKLFTTVNSENLSGAFYFNHLTVANLSLITI